MSRRRLRRHLTFAAQLYLLTVQGLLMFAAPFAVGIGAVLLGIHLSSAVSPWVGIPVGALLFPVSLALGAALLHNEDRLTEWFM